MEKYGTDYSTMPPSDDILRELKKQASYSNKEYKQPKTMDEAIKELEKISK